MEHEMNFFDLCAAGVRALGRLCVQAGQVLARMARLTVRYWWVVITLVLLAIAAAFYYTRLGNLTYKVNAVALLNGPSIQQFEQAFAPLSMPAVMPEGAAVTPYVKERTARSFKTFRVIDCLDDGKADYIDFKSKSNAADTVRVQMHDRLCIQFRIKSRNLDQLPAIEEAMLAFINSNEALQQSYAIYLPNLQNEAAFNHAQAQKLDSLTSAYYFFHASNASPMNYNGNGVNFYGDRRIVLFLDKLYDQREHLQSTDYRLQLATAPVVLENHFSVDSKPVNGRFKMLFIFCLLAWFGGCAIAEMIDKRKAICAWLKK